MLDLAAIRARLQTVVPGALHRQAAADIAALLSELDRLQSGGCARDQRTTQFCAEVVAKDAEIRRLTSELAAARRVPVPVWTPWTDGCTELRCGLLLVAKLRRCNANTIEGCIPAIGELPGSRGTIGVFSGPKAHSAWVAYLATLELPPPPPESGL